VFAGRGVAVWMADYLQSLPLVGEYHQQIGLGLVVLITTYFSLVIGELVPKRLALASSGDDRDLGRVAAPFVRAPLLSDGAFARACLPRLSAAHSAKRSPMSRP
jgi:hypothetical protein